MILRTSSRCIEFDFLSPLFLQFSSLNIDSFASASKVFVNREVYNIGTVGLYETNNTTTIVGIILGIVAALVVGAGLALVVMMYFRKKKQGEEKKGGGSNTKRGKYEHTVFTGAVCLLSHVS